MVLNLHFRTFAEAPTVNTQILPLQHTHEITEHPVHITEHLCMTDGYLQCSVQAPRMSSHDILDTLCGNFARQFNCRFKVLRQK